MRSYGMGLMISLDDLPPRLRAIAMSQLQGQRIGQDATCVAIPTQPIPRHTPTKTEAAYRQQQLSGMDARYEALIFRLANGHRYTPDWVCVAPDGRITCHEVKGSYRLGSYQRARMAFDQARLEWPAITWIWAEKTKTGWAER